MLWGESQWVFLCLFGNTAFLYRQSGESCVEFIFVFVCLATLPSQINGLGRSNWVFSLFVWQHCFLIQTVCGELCWVYFFCLFGNSAFSYRLSGESHSEVFLCLFHKTAFSYRQSGECCIEFIFVFDCLTTLLSPSDSLEIIILSFLFLFVWQHCFLI